jgi:hypothetical protein
LGGAIVVPPVSVPSVPVSDMEILSKLDGFRDTINSLSEKVNNLMNEDNFEREVVRNEKGRIVKIRKVRKQKDSEEIE